MLKAEQRKFNKLAVAHIVAIGGVVIEDDLDILDPPHRRVVLSLATRGGDIRLTPSGNAVYCRFDNVELANQMFGRLLDHNRFSGKHNFHLFRQRIAAADALDRFKQFLSRTL